MDSNFTEVVIDDAPNYHNKLKNIIILILTVVILVLAGFIVYGFLTNDVKEEEENKDNTIKTVTDESIINLAYEKLSTDDGKYSMHYKEANVDAKSADDFMIIYAVKEYLLDRLITLSNYPGEACGGESYALDPSIISGYISSSFNTNRKINYSDSSNLSVGTLNISYRDDGLLYLSSNTCGSLLTDKIYSSVTSAMELDNNIVIYDDYIDFIYEGNGIYYRSESNSLDKTYFCSIDAKEGENPCPDSLDTNNLSAMYNYFKSNLPSAIGHFKHTFSEVEKDGEKDYAWISTIKES